MTIASVPVPTDPPKKSASPIRKSVSNKITDIKITMGFNTPDGVRQEAVFNVPADTFIIDSYAYSDEEKVAKAKDEEGNLIGFEPTGEHTLTLKVKYHENL